MWCPHGIATHGHALGAARNGAPCGRLPAMGSARCRAAPCASGREPPRLRRELGGRTCGGRIGRGVRELWADPSAEGRVVYVRCIADDGPPRSGCRQPRASTARIPVIMSVACRAFNSIEERYLRSSSRCCVAERAACNEPPRSDRGDFIVYVDESGDHGLTRITDEYPLFVLAFCVFRIDAYVGRVVPRVQRRTFDFSGTTWSSCMRRIFARVVHPSTFCASPIGLGILRPDHVNRAWDLIRPKMRVSPRGEMRGHGLKVFP